MTSKQNFVEAEKYLDEAYNFSQADPHIHRELMRVRILQLLNMGFRERDILDAFKERSSVTVSLFSIEFYIYIYIYITRSSISIIYIYKTTSYIQRANFTITILILTGSNFNINRKNNC